MDNKAKRGGIGLLGLLGLLFVYLKLTGSIAWSWWWVLVPFWGPVALAIIVCVIIILAVAVSSANGNNPFR